jgi:methylated-DNA-[protein]-cysteine S-methyltransferase
MLRHATLPSPLGDLLAVAAPDGLAGLYFPEHRRGPQVGEGWREAPELFGALSAQLTAHFRGERCAFDLDLALSGTPFQLAVWQQLRAIPYGRTVTYGELAAAVGRPTAVRAVAGAVARNPVSIVVPCHRVVGAGGAITGFAGGLWRKRRLLELEVGVASASVPY